MKALKIKSRLFMGLKNAPADLTLAKLNFFYGPTYADNKAFELDDYNSLLMHPEFNSSKHTVLYVFGYLENLNVESVHVIVDAYLQRDDTNIIILDWGELADGNYAFDAVINIKQLGPKVAQTLLNMFDNGLDIEKLHIVGHSLGGQMSGIIGREIYRKSNQTKKLKRISALDPAFPLFYMGAIVTPLNKDDAEFVDVIHTDAWIYGAPFRTGTVDFWPNSGKTLQPGCPKRNYKMLSDNDLSSHRRSWWFWAESVTGRFAQAFVSVKAKSWSDFKNGKHIDDNNAKAVMGNDCPTNISGDYFLQTNGITPYARGETGIKYVDPSELIGNSCEGANNT